MRCYELNDRRRIAGNRGKPNSILFLARYIAKHDDTSSTIAGGRGKPKAISFVTRLIATCGITVAQRSPLEPVENLMLMYTLPCTLRSCKGLRGRGESLIFQERASQLANKGTRYSFHRFSDRPFVRPTNQQVAFVDARKTAKPFAKFHRTFQLNHWVFPVTINSLTNATQPLTGCLMKKVGET